MIIVYWKGLEVIHNYISWDQVKAAAARKGPSQSTTLVLTTPKP